jgi:hopanoid biosynthesis associated glycosyl transferase protein HpnI
MDDVDAVQAQISHNMLQSGDWVTARLDGVAYLEKSPMGYWLSATSYSIFGVHDWAARLPLSLAVIGLCFVVCRFGSWAFGEDAGFYSGLVLSTSVGLFLFTRLIIPDAILTLTITVALWSFLRALEPGETRPKLWAYLTGLCLGLGLLLKGLIATVFPVGAAFIYLVITRQILAPQTWKKLRPFSILLIMGVVAVPWYVLATLRNPPYFEFSMHSGPGQYHGFFWFYFMNEHVLRFLNLRYPRDYNTVPRLWFWLFHFLWLFPWSLYAGAIFRLDFRPSDRAGRTRLLALCWIGVVLGFFTLSTTQEYYSMPTYPAFALLLGCAIATDSKWVRRGSMAIASVAAAAFAVIAVILLKVWNLAAPGDIAAALVQHPERYTLSLGHMGDLTLQSFAYLRLPLAMAGIAAFVGAAGIALYRNQKRTPLFATVLMMLIFFHAARVAMIAFDPYLGSKPLADALTAAPPGKLIEAGAYYAFSSVFFYTNRTALLWNGRRQNLEYGSYAPGAPQVFIDDEKFQQLWRQGDRYYLLAEEQDAELARKLVGDGMLHVVKQSGGKYLLTNLEMTGPGPGLATGGLMLIDRQPRVMRASLAFIPLIPGWRFLLAVSVIGLVSSTVYLGLVIKASTRFRRQQDSSISPETSLPRVTLLKPLHGLEPGLERNLESFFLQDYPDFEIIFGARNADDPALRIVEELRIRYPRVKTDVVLSGEPEYPNAKVFALERMIARAATPYLVITDSDVCVGPECLRDVITPLLDPANGVVTCLYRGLAAGGFWSRLEALGMSIELTSGVLVADMLEGMRFALGPTMAIRRDVLDSIGGIAALGHYCADDYMLGNLAYVAGKRVVLSEHVIGHVAMNTSARASLTHQIRWMRSTRFSRSAGHLGTGLTYAMPFGLLGMAAGILAHNWALGLGLLSWAYLNRVIQAIVVGTGVVRDSESSRLCWLYPLRDLMGFIVWCGSFAGSEIVWRSERYRLVADGKMVRV